MAFPVSGLFLDALRGGQYQSVVTADVYYLGAFIASLPISDGSITIDRTGNIRRTLTCTIANPAFIPLFASSALSPYGSEIRVKMGIRFPDQSVEMCQMGVFSIYSINWTEGDGSVPQITAYDYGKRIDDAVFIKAVDASGNHAIQLITHLIQDVVQTDVVMDPDLVDYIVPGGTVMDQNRWEVIQSLLDPMGAECFFDVYGNAIVQPVPSVSSTTTDDDIAWTIDCGTTGVLVSAGRSITRDGTFNFVTAMGTATTDTTEAPPVGYAADNDPTSPTYWGPATSVPNGPYVATAFGQVVLRYENTNMTTSAQCTAAANAQLANVLGLQKNLDLTTVPNAALDAGDIVKTVFNDGSFEYHLIDVINISLGADSFACQTRASVGVLPTS